MSDQQLKKLIFDALNNATNNGCDFIGQCAESIAEDLKRCDSDLEGYDLSDMLPAIDEWQNEQ